MKNGKFPVKNRKFQAAHPTQRRSDQRDGGLPFLPHWALIALCLVVAGGGTWALFELVIWNNLPSELVGKWIVVGGEQDGATFDFSRTGNLQAHMNNSGREVILSGKVAVADNRLLITTRNPNTERDETRSCVIRELNATNLTVEFEKGQVFRMIRP